MRNEPNARIHVVAGAVAILLGLVLKIGVGDWRWIALAIALVFAAEAFNTAIEQICNRLSPQADPVVKIVKDVAAGAVLVCAIAAAAIGIRALRASPAAVRRHGRDERGSDRLRRR